MSASVIRIKRSAIPGKKPQISDLQTGELSLNTFDAELYVKRIRAGIGTDIVRIGSGATVTNILYVTKDGTDTNTGKKLGDAKGTIKGAVAAATEGTVIKVSAGIYIEDNPIVLPDNVSVVGDSLREVSVIPQNQEDFFHVGKGCYIAEMSYLPLNGQANPNAIFAFDPVNLRYIDQSPYIQNCTNFIPESIGLKVDGNDALGPLKSMVLDSYTQYNPAGTGASMTNEGYAQLVSLFTICDDIAVYCGSGGACDLTNSNASFGNYGLIADGVGPLRYKGYISQTFENGSDTFVVNLSTPTLRITNAKWDNNSGILTAYTNIPHDFSVGMTVQLNNLGFQCLPISSPISISNATYDNVSGVATIYTQTPHNFTVGLGVSIVGLGFTCPSGPAVLTYPSGSLGYNFKILPVGFGSTSFAVNVGASTLPHTYVSGGTATNLYEYFIEKANSSVTSASYDHLSGIATIGLSGEHNFSVGHAAKIVGLGFTCPSGPGIVTYPSGNLGYVFKVDKIVDSTTFTVNVGTSTLPHTYNSGGTVESIGRAYPSGKKGNKFKVLNVAPGRYLDAYDSIIANKQEIQDKSLAAIAINYDDYPTFFFPGEEETNDRSRYYDAYRLIQKNRSVIVDSAWTNTVSLYPGISGTQTKCKRDLGYFIDAISADVFTGGNKYSRDFTKQYFSNGSPIGNGLVGEEVQSIYAFAQARELMKDAITNTLVGAAYSDLTITGDPNPGSNPPPYGTPGNTTNNTNSNSCFNVQTNIDNLVGIVTAVIGSGSLSYLDTFSENLGTLTDGAKKCYRDIGYIIDAVALDVRDYTNKNIIQAVKSYFNADGTPLINGVYQEDDESIVAFHAVRDYTKLAINNQLNAKNFSLIPDPLTGSNNNINSCTDVKDSIDSLVGILTTRIKNGNLNTLGLPSVSVASTVFYLNVGTSTLPHTYLEGGIVKIDVIRPFDGQVVVFKDLYSSVKKVNVIDGGSGYTNVPNVTLDFPSTDWGIPASVVPEIRNGKIVSLELVSSGRGYTSTPRIMIEATNVGVTTAKVEVIMQPDYYYITESTALDSNGDSEVTVSSNIPYTIGIGTEVYFYKQSRVLASGHSLEYIGAGTNIDSAIPFNGGVPIQDNETDSRDGGLVVFTTTDQSGNFRIGDGVIVNQATGTISGTFYSKSLFSTITPFILALGGE